MYDYVDSVASDAGRVRKHIPLPIGASMRVKTSLVEQAHMRKPGYDFRYVMDKLADIKNNRINIGLGKPVLAHVQEDLRMIHRLQQVERLE